MTIHKKNMNFKFLSIFMFIVIVTFLFKERYDMISRDNNNQYIIKDYEFFKDFSLDEFRLQNILIGEKIDFINFKQINDIKYNGQFKLFLFVDVAICSKCFKDILAEFLLEVKDNNKILKNIGLVISSRNLSYAKKYTQDYIHQLPIFIDKNFYFTQTYGIKPNFTYGLILNESNICIAIYKFISGMDTINSAKIKILNKYLF